MSARTVPRSAPVNGTAALKIETSPSAQETRTGRTPVSAPQRGLGRQEEAGPERGRRSTPVLMLGILAVAAVVVMTLFSYARLVVINDQVVSLRSQLSQLQADQTKLLAEYELAYDLQEIESQMINSGQMNKIQSWQSYTLELSEPDEVEFFQDSNLKGDLVEIARRVVDAIREYF